MKSLNGRRVSLCRVHAIVHVPGIGQMGPAIDANSGKVLGALTLLKVEGGVVISGRGTELFIPDGNIVSCVMEPELPLPPPPAPAKK